MDETRVCRGTWKYGQGDVLILAVRIDDLPARSQAAVLWAQVGPDWPYAWDGRMNDRRCRFWEMFGTHSRDCFCGDYWNRWYRGGARVLKGETWHGSRGVEGPFDFALADALAEAWAESSGGPVTVAGRIEPDWERYGEGDVD